MLPKLGIPADVFWREVNQQAIEAGEEPMLTYMRLLLEKAEETHVHIGRRELRALGANVEYFPGVESWFTRINGYVRKSAGRAVTIRHYVISAGLREILDGVTIKRYFRQIFASEYHYNHHQFATFPKTLITDTTKTQYLFRINKGMEDPRESINSHMPLTERPIPFENIIYIGDGETDVPGMAVTRQNGGNAIAVYREGRTARARRSRGVCRELLKAGRVNFVAPANYSKGSLLEGRVSLLLDSIVARISYQRELFECRREEGVG